MDSTDSPDGLSRDLQEQLELEREKAAAEEAVNTLEPAATVRDSGTEVLEVGENGQESQDPEARERPEGQATPE